jgi:peroxiredoxin (alkyl hydroperoxide reductase subunit C)
MAMTEPTVELPIPRPPKALVGRPAPDFSMPSTRNLRTLDEPVRLADFAGRWLVLFFYPLDFTFVCPTELRALSERCDAFRAEGAEIVGVSVDSVFTHRAWLSTPPERGGLGALGFPLASDLSHEVSKAYGVYLEAEGHSLRGTFLIDPAGVLRSALIHDLDVGRSVDETLRALQAFKTGSLCPVDWRPGQPTLEVSP